MSVYFSPSFRTCAPLAGPGVYCSRSVIFPLSSFSFVLMDPCGRDGVREHLRERTRTDGTEPAKHPDSHHMSHLSFDGRTRSLDILALPPRAGAIGWDLPMAEVHQ